jgi:hypothetical protein
MAGNAAAEERLTCERCHAYVAIELEESPRLRCALCGFSKELTEEEARRGLEADAAAGAKPPSVPEIKRVSATSLLDFAPSPKPPRLVLSSEDTNPNIGELVAAAKAEVEEPKPDSIEALDPDDLEDAVESVREPAPISLESTALEEDDDEQEPHETVSIKDMVVVPELVPDSTPAPPVRGALRTLPPTPTRPGSTPPPPTINVEEEREQAGEKSLPPPKAAIAPQRSKEGPKRSWVVPALVASAAALVVWKLMGGSPPRPDPAPPLAATATATATTATAPTTGQAIEPAEEPPTIVSAPPSPEPAPAETTKPVAPKAAETKPPEARVTEPKAVEPKVTEAKPAEPKPAGESLSMSELLDRAGSAKRGGDLKTARDYYDRVLRQNPGNVEANGGLGDVARAQGDLAAAKSSYERALAASPSYGPAQLGLADTEWDLGNHAAAQRRYAQIVERLGDRAPQRAKERSAAE